MFESLVLWGYVFARAGFFARAVATCCRMVLLGSQMLSVRRIALLSVLGNHAFYMSIWWVTAVSTHRFADVRIQLACNCGSIFRLRPKGSQVRLTTDGLLFQDCLRTNGAAFACKRGSFACKHGCICVQSLSICVHMWCHLRTQERPRNITAVAFRAFACKHGCICAQSRLYLRAKRYHLRACGVHLRASAVV